MMWRAKRNKAENGNYGMAGLRVLFAAAVLMMGCCAAGAQGPGTRVVNDAHNCYPYNGKWADRIDTALRSGLPVSIEQDIDWYNPGNGKEARSVLSHGRPDGSEPTIEQYFFERVRPIVEAALKNPDHSSWPLITVTLDFKSNAPGNVEAVWQVLQKYQGWLTTAEKATDDKPQLLHYGPLLILSGSSAEQQKVFYDDVPVGGKLLTFGAVHLHVHSKSDLSESPDVMETEPASNYRRWWQASWELVEPEGQPRVSPWTAEKQKRLQSFVDHAHKQGLWLRFFTLDGVSPQELADRGMGAGYNFPSPEAAQQRWDAAIAAGVDYIASDEYSELGKVIRESQQKKNLTDAARTTPPSNIEIAGSILHLMENASKHAKAHGDLYIPVLDPDGGSILSSPPRVDLAAFHQVGIKVVTATDDNPDSLRQLIRQRVDGILSDRPDIVRQVLAEEAQHDTDKASKRYFASFNNEGHRGMRGLRPENTIPAFEAGLDNFVTTLETDTGVTSDHVSLIWHDQALNPAACRFADGTPYTKKNLVWVKDITMAEAQQKFICDKVPFSKDQQNDLALSPVSVAFAKKENLSNPYVPTNVAQLFRFVRFYVVYYKSGAGKGQPEAEKRWKNAEKVRFDLETKLSPVPVVNPLDPNSPLKKAVIHTFGPDEYVQALCGAIVDNNMQSRSDVESADYRTLVLIQERYKSIPTVYLTGPAGHSYVPPELRDAVTNSK